MGSVIEPAYQLFVHRYRPISADDVARYKLPSLEDLYGQWHERKMKGRESYRRALSEAAAQRAASASGT